MAGAGGKTWHAYLSTDTVDARSRIGSGPLVQRQGRDDRRQRGTTARAGGTSSTSNRRSAKRVKSSQDVATPQSSRHPHRLDPEGTRVAGKNCMGWTSSDAGTTLVGHHDRIGLRDDAPSKSWNSSHETRGCGQDALRSTGGDGLLYCFASAKRAY